MIMMFLKYQFAGIWPLLTYFGTGGIIIIACVVLYLFEPAWITKFFPRIHKALIWIAAVVMSAIIFTSIGVTLGERRIQAQWDVARANAVENAKQARAGAVRDVARKPSRWLPNKRDRNDRDGQ